MVIRKPSSDNKIHIGIQGEDLAYTVAVQITSFVQNFDIGEFAALFCRPGETDVYPVEITTDEKYIYWTPNIFDMQIAGNAKFELQYFVHNSLIKSKVYTCIIDEGLMMKPNAPVVLQPWVDNINNAIDNAQFSSRQHAYIDEETNHWMLYDFELNEYVDSGIDATGPKGDPYTSSEEFQTLIADTVEIANNIKDECEIAVTHYPRVGSNGNWEVWNDGWVDTDVHAKGDTGNSAVAIGPSEPTDENIRVWVNTAGDSDDISGRVISDVRVGGESIVRYGIATVPAASNESVGVVKANPECGISADSNGILSVTQAQESDIDAGVSSFLPIVPQNLNYAVMKSMSSDSYSEWDDDSKSKAREKIGISKHKKIFDLTWNKDNYDQQYEIDCSSDMREYYISLVAPNMPSNSVQSKFGFKFKDGTTALCQRYVYPSDYKFIARVSIIGDWIIVENMKTGLYTTPSTCSQWIANISQKAVDKILLDFDYGYYLPSESQICVYEG